MARKIVRIGCVPMIVRAKSNMMLPPTSASHPQRLFCSARAAARVAELLKHPVRQCGWRRRFFGKFVVKIHRLPFESAKLVEWLHFDPLDVRHRGDETGNPRDVFR